MINRGEGNKLSQTSSPIRDRGPIASSLGTSSAPEPAALPSRRKFPRAPHNENMSHQTPPISVVNCKIMPVRMVTV
ncbi:hypothetical protein GWI33_013616 [Rhynchophorus ferrugineus]|uniref:Uncharacterized protein n=1 Tax=Rhynchophorus ferrugineus TaxID=354439 RepID=A0A834I485_RHYFE|nr:hypothetical protein GWI33_013616 [Rhynchophorus ferrugineus]